MRRKKFLGAAIIIMLLSGCTMPSGDELLAAPKPAANYRNLQTELEKQLETGINYTAPAKGENRSSIQLEDLDGDGFEEAIVFFKNTVSASENNFVVNVYRKQEDERYVCTGSIEGSGTAIQSVEYPAITPEGRKGIVITWLLQSDGVNALTMCDFDTNLSPRTLLETEYTAMSLTDLTGNGAKELLLITNETNGKRIARMYRYSGGSLTLDGTTALNEETVSIEKVSSGKIKDGINAVFAEGKTASGVGLTTDVFVYSKNALQNLALSGEDRTLISTYRPVPVYSMDINSDGVTELPRAVLMAGYRDATDPNAVFMLDWYSYSTSGTPEKVLTTYQNVSDAWAFMINDAWHDTITAEKSNENGLSTVYFYEYSGSGKHALFSISCATGTSMEYYAGSRNVIHLWQTDKAVYFARMPQEGQTGSIHINTKDIKARFSLIKQDWSY